MYLRLQQNKIIKNELACNELNKEIPLGLQNYSHSILKNKYTTTAISCIFYAIASCLCLKGNCFMSYLMLYQYHISVVKICIHTQFIYIYIHCMQSHMSIFRPHFKGNVLFPSLERKRTSNKGLIQSSYREGVLSGFIGFILPQFNIYLSLYKQ